MRLASKWADEPDLVEEAQKQDHVDDANVITCKKGEPLVSRWADSSGDEQPDEKGEDDVNVRLGRRGTKKGMRHEGKNDLASRLGELAVSTGHDRGDNHGDNHGEAPIDRKTNDKVPPTKAARDFAARLGIKLDNGSKSHSGAERKLNREKKSRSNAEWDKAKRDSTHDASPLRSLPAKPRGDATRYHKKHVKHHERGAHDKKEEQEKPFNQEEFNRIFAKEYQLNEDIANGKKVDWSAFDDDDDF